MTREWYLLPCDKGIINEISLKRLDYSRLEFDRNVRGAYLQ